MKKLIGLALLAGAATAGVANAEGSFSGNVALTTDYVFRGVSQSDGDIAIQGGFDYANGMFYAGTWASSIDFGLDGTVEVDVYGGVKPTLGPVTFDIGVIGYLYPGMTDAVEADMWELKVGASGSPVENLSIYGTLYYSPDFTFTFVPPNEDADGLYLEAGASYLVNDVVSISGAVGNQNVDDDTYFPDGLGTTDNYTTWNIGGTVNVAGFAIDLRYYDTDMDPSFVGPSGDDTADGRAVLSLKRAL
jgi:uncharacterized protein (TIGR02001 family)